MRKWSRRQWATAAIAAIVIGVVIGIPTDVIPNPVFGRPVPVTWWSPPVLAVSAALAGLLVATYVRTPVGEEEVDRSTRAGGAAGLLTFFAVGCPVCNKIVVVALGTVGARTWFEPLQPVLAVASVVLMGWALRERLRSARSCPVSVGSPV